MSDEKSVLQQGFDLVSEGASAAHAASTKMLEEIGLSGPIAQVAARGAEIALGGLMIVGGAAAVPEGGIGIPIVAAGVGLVGDGVAGALEVIKQPLSTFTSTAETTLKPTGTEKSASQTAESVLPQVEITGK